MQKRSPPPGVLINSTGVAAADKLGQMKLFPKCSWMYLIIASILQFSLHEFIKIIEYYAVSCACTSFSYAAGYLCTTFFYAVIDATLGIQK